MSFTSKRLDTGIPWDPQEFNIEKLQLLEAEKGKIRKDSERRESQIDVKKKIEYSKQLNASRIKARFIAQPHYTDEQRVVGVFYPTLVDSSMQMPL